MLKLLKNSPVTMAYSIRRAADGYQLSTNQKPVKIDPTMEVEYLIGIQKEYFLSFIIATTWYNQESGDTIFPNSQFLSALKKAILWHIISIVSESFKDHFFRPKMLNKRCLKAGFGHTKDVFWQLNWLI